MGRDKGVDMIKFDNKEVNISDIQRLHNLSYVEVYKLKSNNMGGSFTIGNFTYTVEPDGLESKTKKRYTCTIEKGCTKFSGLTPKEVSYYTERSLSIISSKTKEHGSGIINGWYVERDKEFKPSSVIVKLCSKSGCTNKAIAKGLCAKHYQRKNYGKEYPEECNVEGCDNKYHAKGMCRYHYQHDRYIKGIIS